MVRRKRFSRTPAFGLLLLIPPLLVLAIGLACVRAGEPFTPPWSVSSPDVAATRTALAAATPAPGGPGLQQTLGPALSPTPDQPHPAAARRAEAETYIVQPGDTLGLIARRYQVSLEALAAANNLANPNFLEVGQVLNIPVAAPGDLGPSFKVIPDAELVYGPPSAAFDVRAYLETQRGYLRVYSEVVDGRSLSGAEIVARVASEYSVGPRLLLAVLEYRSGWVTRANPDAATLDYPIIRAEAWRKGLYRQLAWAADNLNSGYYRWRVGAVADWLLADGSAVAAHPQINAGTAGVQNLFAALFGRAEWQQAVSEGGLYAVYQNLFGFPFYYSFEPLLPPDLVQPELLLPFEPGQEWAFTGGPHGGWGSGSAWAALDFAPPGGIQGCTPHSAWVTAVADGLVVRAENGMVVQDLDTSGPNSSDGLEQTGWVVVYGHIYNEGRTPVGTYLRAGERIGHPSCEGGFSTATHLHLSRRYNGEWIPADQNLPFVLDGWVSSGAGREYDGYLRRDGVTLEAWEGYRANNLIQRMP